MEPAAAGYNETERRACSAPRRSNTTSSSKCQRRTDAGEKSSCPPQQVSTGDGGQLSNVPTDEVAAKQTRAASFESTARIIGAVLKPSSATLMYSFYSSQHWETRPWTRWRQPPCFRCVWMPTVPCLGFLKAITDVPGSSGLIFRKS